MKIKEGGGMDVQEAREAFERRQAKVLNVPYEGLKAHFDENSRLFGARYNTGSINEKEWNLWLEAWQAKAQAVPEGFGDIQSWIAVNSFSALDASMDDFLVVDANELAKYIDSLIEAQEPTND